MQNTEKFILNDRKTAWGLIYGVIYKLGQVVSPTKSGTNGIPNKGSVGHGTICLKEGLSHSKWDGWTV